MEIVAREVQRGANTVHGVEATLWQVVFGYLRQNVGEIRIGGLEIL